MSAFASLALQNNAAATVTFVPQKIDSNGVAVWMTSNAVYDGKQKATLSVKLPQNGSTVVRVTGKVTLPIMDTVDTTKKVAECVGTFELLLPKQASQTNRLDIRKELDTFLTNAVVTSAVQDFEAIY